jgi:hypothetical protein
MLIYYWSIVIEYQEYHIKNPSSDTSVIIRHFLLRKTMKMLKVGFVSLVVVFEEAYL